MLTIPRDTLGWIVLKAREFDVKDVDTSNGDGDDAPEAWDVLEDRPDDPTEAELRSWIGDLSDTQKAELVALMWLGRGDGDAEGFADLVEQARAARTGPTADYLLGEPQLAALLEEGLEALGLPFAELEADL